MSWDLPHAGMAPIAPSLLDTPEALVDKIIDINFKGPLRLTALAATAMTATGGGSAASTYTTGSFITIDGGVAP